MEIRDVIHGAIRLDAGELPVLDSRYFQRLRHIKQLGFGENSFPNASHNRYVHSLGAMHTAGRCFSQIFHSPACGLQRDSKSPPFQLPPLRRLAPGANKRFRAAVRLAAMLHDVGHGPLSHTSERAMPPASHLGIAGAGSRQATHEDYTLKIILDSGLTPVLSKSGRPFGLKPLHLAELIDRELPSHDDFFVEDIEGEAVDFRPLLTQLISSELDCDRMDYLRRDSFHAGVSYGVFDSDWISSNLTCFIRDGRAYLALQHRALLSFEDFLISRFHMFLMVYFHYKSVIYDEMLAQYFAGEGCDYALPADIEAYCDRNDAHLYAHLAASRDPWARRISEKRPFRVLTEIQSGIPATARAASEQTKLLARIRRELDAKGVRYLESRSTGELSKYFKRPGPPIYVRYDNHYSAPGFIPIEKCTDLFLRYGEKRQITRLYVEPERFDEVRPRMPMEQPLRYEEETATTAPA